MIRSIIKVLVSNVPNDVFNKIANPVIINQTAPSANKVKIP